MSNTDDMPKKRYEDIVRLKINGIKTSVNTLREQQTAKGVSLICPFPALEVDIPACVGQGEEMMFGSIHRIGVEDDPETGLPRLRLQVRTHDSRETTVREASRELLDEASCRTEVPEEVVDNDDTENMGREMSEPVEPTGALETDADAGFFGFGQDIDTGGVFEQTDVFYDAPDGTGEVGPDQTDPGWVGCEDFPAPAEFQQRMKTRRRYKAVKFAVLTFVLGMVVATGYTLERAGILDFGNMKDRFSPLASKEDASPQKPVAMAELEAPVTPDMIEEVGENEVALTEAKTPDSTPPVNRDAPLNPKVAEASYKPTPESYAPTADDYAVAVPEPKKADVPSEGAVEEIEESEVTLTLPTKWPVEYTTAYRVRDPNGVVVDVPGGLVKREGWLDMANRYPLVRSIKAVQRENGARFIIYVTGELPRFITTPRSGGVGLRLFYGETSEKSATVASLEK